MTNLADTLQITSTGEAWALFSDGARVSWQNDMVCTCITAKKQRPSHNMCKHIVEVIRQRRDLILGDRGIFLAVSLGVKATDEISWVSIRPDPENQTLWAALADQGMTFVAHMPAPICRLDARVLVIPHLLGYCHQITCKVCGGVPSCINAMLLNRDDPEKQMEAIREVCHWMDDPTLELCREHDDSDLVPF